MSKKNEEEKLRHQVFSKLLNMTKKSIEESRMEMKQQSTLRSLATLKVRIDLKRQENNLSKHYREFEIEYRADQHKLYRIAFDFINSTYFQ